MYIKQKNCGPIDTNCTLVADPSTKEAALFDAPTESFDWIQEQLTTLDVRLKAIYLTHSHWDHIGDLRKFVDSYSLPVFVHLLDAPNVECPGNDGLPLYFHIDGVSVSHYLQEGEQYSVGSYAFSVLETPGHSKGSVVFYFPTEKTLISGDTLFKGSYGRVDLPTSEPQKMLTSLKRLAALPDETVVYPGHGPTTKIVNESRWLQDPENFF